MLADKKYISLGSLVCGLFFGLSLALADTAQDANEHYQQGYNALDQKNWGEAAQHFRLSYQAIPRSDVAYLLSVAYSKLSNPTQASQFARKALSDKPPLREPYAGEARKIMEWAKGISKVTMESDGKADRALPPPPQVALPGRESER